LQNNIHKFLFITEQSTSKAAVKLGECLQLSSIWMGPVEKRRQCRAQVNVFFFQLRGSS
jgi:hypothetical protein